MPPGISILLPTYNRASALAQTLEAIERSDREGLDLELIVIDNNSDDDTANCVQRFQGRLPIVLLHEPRPGKNCALNRAVRERQLRDLIVFVDDDITPDPGWLKEIVEASRRWPKVSVFGAKVKVGWPTGTAPEWAVADWIKVFGFAWHDLGEHEKPYNGESTPMGPCYWVRREVFLAVPEFDESVGPRPRNRIMGSEVSFLWQLHRRGYRMMYCPRVVVEHRIRSEECRLPALKRRAYRCGRGEIRVYGNHRPQLLAKGRLAWSAFLLFELAAYSGTRLVLSWLWPTRRGRAELALRAMVRVGKITESLRGQFKAR